MDSLSSFYKVNFGNSYLLNSKISDEFNMQIVHRLLYLKREHLSPLFELLTHELHKFSAYLSPLLVPLVAHPLLQPLLNLLFDVLLRFVVRLLPFIFIGCSGNNGRRLWEHGLHLLLHALELTLYALLGLVDLLFFNVLQGLFI